MRLSYMPDAFRVPKGENPSNDIVNGHIVIVHFGLYEVVSVRPSVGRMVGNPFFSNAENVLFSL